MQKRFTILSLFSYLLVSCSVQTTSPLGVKKSLLIKDSPRFQLDQFIFEALHSKQFKTIQSEVIFRDNRSYTGLIILSHNYVLSSDRKRCAEASDYFRFREGFPETRFVPKAYNSSSVVQIIQGKCIIAKRADLIEPDYIISTLIEDNYDSFHEKINLYKKNEKSYFQSYDNKDEFQKNVWEHIDQNPPNLDHLQVPDEMRLKPIPSSTLTNVLNITDDDLINTILAGGTPALYVYGLLNYRFKIEFKSHYEISIEEPISKKVIYSILKIDFEKHPHKGQQQSAFSAIVAGVTPEMSKDVLPFLIVGLSEREPFSGGSYGYENPLTLSHASLVASQLDDDSIKIFYEKYKDPIEKLLHLQSRQIHKIDSSVHKQYAGLHILKNKRLSLSNE